MRLNKWNPSLVSGNFRFDDASVTTELAHTPFTRLRQREIPRAARPLLELLTDYSLDIHEALPSQSTEACNQRMQGALVGSKLIIAAALEAECFAKRRTETNSSIIDSAFVMLSPVKGGFIDNYPEADLFKEVPKSTSKQNAQAEIESSFGDINDFLDETHPELEGVRKALHNRVSTEQGTLLGADAAVRMFDYGAYMIDAAIDHYQNPDDAEVADEQEWARFFNEIGNPVDQPNDFRKEE